MVGSLTLPSLVFFIALLPIFTIFFFYYYFHAPHRRSLNPVNWPIIAHFHHFHNYISDALREVGSTYMFKGPWLFGMDFLLTCDPANVHHVFNANFANYPKGDEFDEMFDVLGKALFGADGESWKIQRKMAHEFIGDRAFRSFALAATRDKTKHGLVPLLDRLAAAGDTVDIENVFSRVTFDITCLMVFGFDPGCLSIDFPTIPFACAIDDFWEAVFFRHFVPNSWWKLLRRFRLGPEKKMARANEVIDHFIHQQISLKQTGSKQVTSRATDVLTYYMNQPLDEVTKFFESKDKFLRDTVLFLMIAGRDAFAIGLSWFFYLLSKNPDVEAKILDELRAHAAKENQIVFDEEELGSMVYLHGAVCETLRLYPPVPIEHKGALKADVLPSGHRVDPGMTILFSVYAMARMEETWGKDCMEFRPERWVSENGKVRHVPAYKFMAFNSGPRSCLGKEIGLMQLKMVVATVVWNFKVKLVEESVVKPKNSGMLRMKNGMKVRVMRREV